MALVALPLVAVGGPALARPVAVGASGLAHGSAAVTGCGNLGEAAVAYRTTGGQVTAVSVTGLPSTCNGASLSLTLATGGTAAGTAGPLVVSGGAVTAALVNGPVSTTVTDVHLVVVG